MLKGMKNLHAKAKAATIVQNLLELPQHYGRFNGASHKIANELVTITFNNSPQMFNGSRGLRPHSIVFAASALAHALKSEKNNYMFSVGFLSSLGTVLEEVQNNSHLYPFTELDRILLTDCFETFEKTAELLNESPLAKEMDSLLNR